MSIIDLAIYESGNGGELNTKNDDIETVSGLTNQVYVALFGGNVNQNEDYWGNEYIELEENKYFSTFENLLNSTALNSAGLSTLENAALKDLQFLKIYAEIEAFASLTDVNKLGLRVRVTEPQNVTTIKFIWDGTKNEIIEIVTI